MIDWRDRINIVGAVIVSTLVVLGFGAVCLALFFFKIQGEMKDLAMLLLGILGAGFTTVVNYWMGSSSSSQKKDNVIAETASTAAAAVVDTAKAAAEKATRHDP